MHSAAMLSPCSRRWADTIAALSFWNRLALRSIRRKEGLKATTPSPQVIGIDEIAIRKGHTYGSIVDLLLRRGADRTLTDKDGKTARDLSANDNVRETLAAR
jgi:hypothetical protein